MHVPIDLCNEREEADVELASFVEQRPFAILLNYVGPAFAVDLVVDDDRLYLLQLSADCDSTPSIRVFTWFHNPKLFSLGWILLDMRVGAWVVVGFFELAKLAVLESLFNVVRQGQVIESFL